MNKKVSFSAAAPVIKEVLDAGEEVCFIPHGVSMLPMLRGGVDKVTLKRSQGRLKKYDIPLYVRADGKCVLHRVVKVLSDSYIMCGDNCTALEYGIKDNDIIGVLVGYEKNGRQRTPDKFFYKIYCFIWVHTRPLRRIYKGLKYRIAKLIKKRRAAAGKSRLS